MGRVLVYSGLLVKGWEDPRNPSYVYRGEYLPRFAKSSGDVQIVLLWWSILGIGLRFRSVPPDTFGPSI